MVVGALIDTAHLHGKGDVKADMHVRRVLGRLLNVTEFAPDQTGQVLVKPLRGLPISYLLLGPVLGSDFGRSLAADGWTTAQLRTGAGVSGSIRARAGPGPGAGIGENTSCIAPLRCPMEHPTVPKTVICSFRKPLLYNDFREMARPLESG